jgi:hypothetical protein
MTSDCFPHQVHVLRESPPVYLVDDFVDESECEYMLDYTMPRMGRSVVRGGGFSNWRVCMQALTTASSPHRWAAAASPIGADRTRSTW